MRTVVATLLVTVALLACPRADAQVIGAHFIHVPASDGRRASLGLQGEIGAIVSTRHLDLWPSLAIEYQRREGLGPGRGRLAAELRLLPDFGEHTFHPYFGGSISANRSGGDRSEWPGALLGVQAMTGIMVVPSERVPIAFLLEERFGYVREVDHATATHLGLLFSFH